MTRVFGVMGFPIGHSLSPRMHQAACQALGLDAVYAPFEVPPRLLAPVLRGLVAAGIDGLNVTVPLKELVARQVDELAEEAKVLQAVNTVVIERGRAIGHNTDVAGFLRALDELGWRPPTSVGAAVVLGAGGAARAVAWALSAHTGTRLTIANRHVARAQSLVRWLRRVRPSCDARAVTLKDVRLDGQDLVVNATTVGMRAQDGLPVRLQGLRKGTAVYDLVYNRPTRLVREARRRGCLAANGTSMLVYQGAESFRLWWHRDPPVDAMRRAVERAGR
ncbi:MAG: shikimate dehydrogenase [Candidatus Omnitrophica bacterium]|nr:shikimate dehydrogenase [Candidatus Omnitrophota bacterium]